jgi:hypothetical protein
MITTRPNESRLQHQTDYERQVRTIYLDTTCTPAVEVVLCLTVSPKAGTVFACLLRTTNTDPNMRLLSFPGALHHTLAPNGCRGP